MTKQNNFSFQENSIKQTDVVLDVEITQTAKKQFIEPEISTPVDVLEATTFFQAIDSGPSGP